jgi:serine/threonine protein kinase
MTTSSATQSIRSPDGPLPTAKPRPTELPPGTPLGTAYRVVRCIARGGMGEVYVAARNQLPGEVVVKVLNPDLSVHNEAIARFRQEAKAMARIHHPNVVRLLDFNLMPDGRPYLVMEHLPGANLAEALAARAFSVKEVSNIVSRVASALDAAHRLGIVHRDLKPENIMVIPRPGRSDLIKVIDFGICKARRLNPLTSKGTVMGTPAFMSPEQAEGRSEQIEAPSDQFALAVIAYLMLAGRMPWGATTQNEILHCVIYKYPLDLTDDGKYRSVEAVLFRAMSKAPRDRYPSILAFSQALDVSLSEAGLLGEVSDEPPPRRSAEANIVTEPLETVYQQRKRGTRLSWVAVSLAVVMFGGYLASTGAPSLRTRADRGWAVVRNFAAGPAARRAVDGQRLIWRASQNAKALLSMESSP